MVAPYRRILAVFASLVSATCIFTTALPSPAAVSGGAAVELSPASPKQGQTMEVLLKGPAGAAPPAVSFNNKTYKMFPVTGKDGTAYRALIGVPVTLKTGAHELKVGDIEKTVSVLPGGYPVQRLHLPKDKDNFISSPGEEAAVDAAKATVSSEQMWDGPFKRPSAARTSTAFGVRRIVNGHLLDDYFHSGLDFAGALGTPVKAAQAGKVILAHNGWRLHGNCVAIDHGQGVISFYIHLNKIEVKPGEEVKAGQEIGKVGMTGRANGPHLHFSVYVNGDATNPLDWFARTY